MRTGARMAKALGAALATAALLLAGAPAADAEGSAPKPEPVNLLSATIAGCQAPCAPDERGEITLTFERPVRPEGVPADAFIEVSFHANTSANGLHEFSWNNSGDPWWYKIPVCAEGDTSPSGCRFAWQQDIRGVEEFSVTVFYMWDCDPIFGDCESISERSDPSNALVPTQV